MSASQQECSDKDAGTSWSKVQHSKNPSRRKQSKSPGAHVSSQLKSSHVGVSQPVVGKLPESISSQQRLERPALGCQGASGNRLFLDFQSLKIMKDADEDSASDLSDSERVALPASPLTPPDLHLRAEEIDPVSFDFHPDQSQAKVEYQYPDFLPPPFSTWDLQEMAVLLNTECRSGAIPRSAGPFGKYINRLIQLEWLQIQTVQCEKAKGTKARPPAIPVALKNPGRSKLLAGALPKLLPPSSGASKSGPSRKKGLHHGEAHPSYYASENSPRPVDVPGHTRIGFQKKLPEMRTEEKKKPSKGVTAQRWDLPYRNGTPGMEAKGNLRIPKQSPVLVDPADSRRAPRAQGPKDLKKKGSAGGCGPATSSTEKKFKTNGSKQSVCRSKSAL